MWSGRNTCCSLLRSQRCDRMAHMTGALHWRDTSSLGRTNQEEEERELPFRAAGVHGALPRYG